MSTVAELIDDLREHVVHHKDRRRHESKTKIVNAALGGRKAGELKPKDLAKWLNSHCKTSSHIPAAAESKEPAQDRLQQALIRTRALLSSVVPVMGRMLNTRGSIRLEVSCN